MNVKSSQEAAEAPPAGAPQGRPRSAEADRAIRVASLELLAREGYANLTMSGVAAAAGVSTATLYRRWNCKLDLVVDVLKERADKRPVPDTGSLAGDCRAVLRGIVEAVTTTPAGSLMAGLVGEIGRNPELADALRACLIEPRRAALIEMFERAAARGELRRGLDLNVVADLLTGPIHHRLLVTGGPISKHVADELADLVVRAVTSPGPTSPSGNPMR